MRGAGCAAGETTSRQEQGAPKAASQLRVWLALLGLWFYFFSCSSSLSQTSPVPVVVPRALFPVLRPPLAPLQPLSAAPVLDMHPLKLVTVWC